MIVANKKFVVKLSSEERKRLSDFQRQVSSEDRPEGTDPA
jgi:hypothetical protein